ncbi:hypothetical protein A3Q56_05155 [Intoshia linei]|uniref:Uncharacterized protein n=1 Tax=Intoshia linei TaxID=1819745 RepID=A0A177B0I8_9BILA|nr:hypothetical protein A3Q56_05155 [Intoshia linei]
MLSKKLIIGLVAVSVLILTIVIVLCVYFGSKEPKPFDNFLFALQLPTSLCFLRPRPSDKCNEHGHSNYYTRIMSLEEKLKKEWKSYSKRDENF